MHCARAASELESLIFAVRSQAIARSGADAAKLDKRLGTEEMS